MSGLLYDPNPPYPVARRITRDPTAEETDAIAKLVRAVRRAAAQVFAEQRRSEEQDRMRRGA